MQFLPFPKIARFHGECIITEKIDGTNVQIARPDTTSSILYVGSRKRFITPQNDNHGFAAWVETNRDVLLAHLPAGRHYGEWWGLKIQRGYGLFERRFTAFDPKLADLMPGLFHKLPVLYAGMFTQATAYECLWTLKEQGSFAAPGFKQPEGIVVYFPATRAGFKLTFKDFEVFHRIGGLDEPYSSSEDIWRLVKPKVYHKYEDEPGGSGEGYVEAAPAST